jgi:hypothetical protein
MASGMGGITNAPGFSLPEVGKNTWLEGLIVPQDVSGSQRPYRVTQQTKFPSGEPLFFRSDDGSQGNPRTQLVIVLQTELRDWAGTSDSFRERVQEAESNGEEVPTDVGLRRLTLKSGKPLNEFKDVLRKSGVQNFEIGGTVRARWTGKEKAKPGSDAQPYIMQYEYAKATEDSVKVARRIFDEHLAKPQDGDPMSGGSGAGGDEPPF